MEVPGFENFEIGSDSEIDSESESDQEE